MKSLFLLGITLSVVMVSALPHAGLRERASNPEKAMSDCNRRFLGS